MTVALMSVLTVFVPMTFVAMSPTLEAMWEEGLQPYLDAPVAERDSMAAWEHHEISAERVSGIPDRGANARRPPASG